MNLLDGHRLLTDACPLALLELAALAPMLAEAAPSALLAGVALAPMLTDAAPSALLALAALGPMGAEIASHGVIKSTMSTVQAFAALTGDKRCIDSLVVTPADCCSSTGYHRR